jgi:Cof subfamily protein (haloacid dehalogenase superfamily)
MIGDQGPSPSRCRLLAVDLDGTLLRDDGTIDPRDQQAVRRARAAGLRVVLATGRLPAACAPIAEALELAQPIIGLDGAGLFSSRGERTLSQWSLPSAARRSLIERCRSLPLALLFLSARNLYGRPQDRAASAYLAGWSAPFHSLDSWSAVVAATDQAAPLAAFALGAAEATAAAAAALTDVAEISWERFELGPRNPHALRVRHARADKGQALAALAATQGLPAQAVAAVGDWYNDMTMLRWASCSFVMGGAPLPVVLSAGQQLQARAGAGGGVAEVIRRLLGGAGPA